jgi:HEAT repeat protein
MSLKNRPMAFISILAAASCCLLLSGCPKKGGPIEEGTADKAGKGGQEWEYCPTGYGWGPEFNEKVIAVLKNEKCNPKDRAEAAMVAGQSYMFDAVSQLLVMLETEKDTTLKLAVIQGLGTFNTKRSLRPFIKLLDDKEPKIRSAAAEGLARIASMGDLIAVDVMKQLARGSDEELKSIALISLGMAGKYMALDGLIELLGSPNATIRQDAVESLGRIADEKAVPALLGLLKDEDQMVRSRVCYALAQIGSSAATKPLLELLEDKEPGVRSAAAYAVGIIGDDDAIEPLLAAFKEADQNERWSLASALSSFGPRVFDIAKEFTSSDKKGIRQYGVDILNRLGDKRALPFLIAALDDTSEDVRRAAAQSLSAGGKAATKALLNRLTKEKSLDVRIEILRTLGYVGDSKAVGPLISAAKDDTARARAEAVRALGYFDDDKAAETLIAALKDESEWVRESAASSLGYMKIMKALDAMIALLEDEDAYVRSNAINTLGRLGDAKAIEPLAKLMDDKNEYVRQAVLMALGDIGGDEALKYVIKGLDDDKEYVRESAIRAVGNILSNNELEDVTAAMIVLSKGLKDENFYVRETAAFSLSRIQIPYTKEVIDALRAEMGEADDYLLNEVFWALSVTKDKKIVSEMLASFAGGNFGVDTPIEEALANAENDEVLGKLRELAGGEDRYLKASAALALSLTSAADGEKLVLPLVKSDDALLKQVGAKALEYCGGKESVGPLTALIDDPDEDVATAACYALTEVSRKTGDTSMVDPLIKLMSSPNHALVSTAAAALGSIGDEKAVDPLLKLFKASAPKLKSSGCGYMCGYVASVGSSLSMVGGEKAAAELLKLLEDPNPRVRREAVYALAGMKFKQGEQIIIDRIKEETDLSLRDALIGLAGQIKSKKAIPEIKKIMNDADNYTRSGILYAIGEIGDKGEGKYVAGFLKDPVRNVKLAAVTSLGQLKYKKATRDLLNLLEDERYESSWYAVIEALVEIDDRDAVVEPFAELAKKTNDKYVLMATAAALAYYKYDAVRPTLEKRLQKFGASAVIFDILAYLYGDTAKGNELYNQIRDIKIPRNADMADVIIRAFDMKGEEGKKYIENLAKEAKSGYVSSIAKSYLRKHE